MLRRLPSDSGRQVPGHHRPAELGKRADLVGVVRRSRSAHRGGGTRHRTGRSDRFPVARPGEVGMAARIASRWIKPDQPQRSHVFPMVGGPQPRQQAWKAAADLLAGRSPPANRWFCFVRGMPPCSPPAATCCCLFSSGTPVAPFRGDSWNPIVLRSGSRSVGLWPCSRINC